MRTIAMALLVMIGGMFSLADAQTSGVQYLEHDGITTVFAVESWASKSEDAIEQAKIAVMKAILFDGLENYNGGNPIIDTPTSRTSDFLDQKKGKYRIFVRGVYREGDGDAGHFIVLVNNSRLVNSMKMSGNMTKVFVE